MRHPNPAKMNVMGGDKLTEWKRSGNEELAKLIVSEERAAWILKRYPPTETGRPGIIHTDSRDRGSNRVRETDDDPADVKVGLPVWRTSLEFEGDEAALEETEIVVGVAAD